MRRILAVFIALVTMLSYAHADYDLSMFSDDDLVVLSRNLQTEITKRAAEKADVLFRAGCDDWEIIIYNDAYIDERFNGRILVIHFAFVNYGAAALNYQTIALIGCFQNGIEISQTRDIGNYDPNGTIAKTNVKDGGMVELYRGFYLDDFSAPFELSIYNGPNSYRYGMEPLASIMLTAPQ